MIIAQAKPLPFYTDFQGYSNAAVNGQKSWALNSGSSGVTATVGTDGTVPSGKSVTWSASAGSSGGIYWARPGTALGAQTILTAVEATAYGAAEQTGPVVTIAGNGASSTFTGFSCLLGGSAAGLKNIIYIYQYSSGTPTERASTAFSWSLNTKYWMKVNITGTTIQAKIWADSGSEPGSWTISYTNASVGSASGRPGFGTGVTSSLTAKIYWFAVATDTATVQEPPWSF